MPLAILGNTPEVSALELGVPWDGGQIAELPGTVDLQRLGGTVKLADVIGNDISDCLSILKSVPSDHKLVFGFSVYAGDHTVTTNQLAAYAKKLRDLGMHWKKQLKESGRSVRLVVSNEPTLSSVIVTKEHLLKDQTDFVVVLYQAKTVIGRTISEPHIYIAFVGKWVPKDYQESTKSWNLETWVDQIPSYKLGNFTFSNENVNVGKPEDFKKGTVPDKIFYYPNGDEAIYAKIN